MPENQNPYLDPNMNPGAAAGPYGNGYPGAMPPEYADPSMAYGAQAQPDPQGGWGAPYGAQADPQAFGAQGYAGMPPMDGGAMPGQDAYGQQGFGQQMPGQDPYAQQGYGQMPGADAAYYGGGQYGGFEQNAGYADPYAPQGMPQQDPYAQQAPVPGQGFYGQDAAMGQQPYQQAYQQPQTQPGAGYADPYAPQGMPQQDPYAQQPPVPGQDFYGQDAAMGQQPYQQPQTQPGAVQPEYAAWQYGGQDAAMGQQPYQQAYQQPQTQPGAVQATGMPGAYAESAMQDGSAVPVATGVADPTYPTKGRALMCFIFGILSIIFGLIPPIGIILAIVTIRMSKKYLANGGTEGKAEAGRIFSFAGLVFSILMLLFMAAVTCYLVIGVPAGDVTATNLVKYFNYSPLGSLFQIPL